MAANHYAMTRNSIPRHTLMKDKCSKQDSRQISLQKEYLHRLRFEMFFNVYNLLRKTYAN